MDESSIKPYVRQYPAGPIFTFRKTGRLSDLLDAVGSEDDTRIARTIFNELAGLPTEERSARIMNINDVVREFGASPSPTWISEGMPSVIAALVAEYKDQSPATFGAASVGL